MSNPGNDVAGVATDTSAPIANVQANGAPRQSGWQAFQSVATRMIVFYFAMQAMSYFRSKPVANQNNVNPNSPVASMGSDAPGNIFSKGSKFDMYVFLSESEIFDKFNEKNSLYWLVNDIEYGNWYLGPNNDDIISKSELIELTPVNFYLFYSCIS